MRIFTCLCLLGLLITSAGCQMDEARKSPAPGVKRTGRSLNQDKAYYKADAITALTEKLDSIPDPEQADEYRWRAHEIGQKVRTYLSSNDVEGLSRGGLRLSLFSLIPEGYDFISAQFVSSLGDSRSKIERADVERLKSTASGLIEASMSYSTKDR